MRAPRFARWLLTRVAPRDDRAALVSDLDEEFEERLAEEGAGPARRWYRLQVVRSLFPLLRLRLQARPGSTDGEGGPLVGLLRDLRTGLRVHLNAPLTTAVILVSLGVGIGATTTVFSIARTFLLVTCASIAS